jgi:SNF2 family DNA or RNA helicase
VLKILDMKRNENSRISRCVKQINSQHRLILSGTPIQNKPLEIWNLFDFLMPGFLGTKKYFIMRLLLFFFIIIICLFMSFFFLDSTNLF